MIKAVAFDLGKVLVDFDYGIAARNIAARSKMTALELAKVIAQTPLLVNLETGLITSDAFYREVCALTGFCGDLEEFADMFGNIFVEIKPMVELHATLRRQGVPTYIFSNTNDLSIRYIRRAFPFFGNFDGYIFSYQHGAMKPDPRLYEVLERQAGRNGPEILYIDDRPENVAGGAVRGWQTILQKTPEKTRAAMQKLGLSV